MKNIAYEDDEMNLKNSKNVINSKEDLSMHTDNNFEYKEGGLGWLVVISCGYCFGILIGMMNNYSLIYNEFDRVYNQTENHVVYSGN